MDGAPFHSGGIVEIGRRRSSLELYQPWTVVGVIAHRRHPSVEIHGGVAVAVVCVFLRLVSSVDEMVRPLVERAGTAAVGDATQHVTLVFERQIVDQPVFLPAAVVI